MRFGPETVRKWVRQAEINAGVGPGVHESDNVEIRWLKKENQELRRANEVLRTTSAFFATKLDHPAKK